MASLESLEQAIKSLHKELRKVHQLLEDPTGEKAKKRSENNSFRKQLKISPKLQSFLGLSADATISRSEVTKAVNKYATEHNLKNGQEIIMDATLTDLLQPPPDTKITYLNIQRYMKHNYIIDEPVAKTVVEPETPAPAPPAKKTGRPAVSKA